MHLAKMAARFVLLLLHLPYLLAFFEETSITVQQVHLRLQVDPSRNLLQVDAVYPTTEGWVAFGLSENGTMAGADVTLAWMRDSGAVYSDRHAVRQQEPTVDAQNDICGIRFDRNSTATHIIFQRPLVSCDESGQDVNVTSDFTRVLVAHGTVASNGGLDPHTQAARLASDPFRILTSAQDAAIIVNCSLTDPCQRFNSLASSTLVPTTVDDDPVIFVTTYLLPGLTLNAFEDVRERVRRAFVGSLNTAASNIRFTEVADHSEGVALTASTRTSPSATVDPINQTLTSNSLLLSVQGAAKLSELPSVIQAPTPTATFGEEATGQSKSKEEVDWLLIGIAAATVVVCMAVVLLSRALVRHCKKVAEQGAYKVDEDNETNVMLTDLSLGPSNDYGLPSNTMQLEMMSELNHAEC
eukprot:m.83345 g.83345  ORF g.83345 m.83345 type:complete len:412 (+) comp14652_c0_seq5:1082-2317(+)